MERSGGGSIVNISSGAGLRGSPQAFAYSTTKWALRGMTKAAAMDLARHKIRVNSIHPGPIETDMLKEWSGDQRVKRLKSVPMRRTGTAEEVAQAVLFLLSDESVVRHRRRGRGRWRRDGVALRCPTPTPSQTVPCSATTPPD